MHRDFPKGWWLRGFASPRLDARAYKDAADLPAWVDGVLVWEYTGGQGDGAAFVVYPQRGSDTVLTAWVLWLPAVCPARETQWPAERFYLLTC